MKIWAWGSVAVLTAVAGIAACGGDNSGTGGGSGGGSVTTSSSSSSGSTSSSSGSTSSSGGTGGSAACGVIWSDLPDCETCMEGACCTEMNACGAGTPCESWYNCAVACTTSACVDGCDTQFASGRADYDGLTACYDNNCQADQACMYPICDSGLLMPDTLKDCADCNGTSCCTEIKACLADTGCAACITANPTQLPANCTDGSATANLYTATQTCQDTNCAAKCTTDICGSGAGYTAPSCNYCLTTNCCTPFNACYNDTACQACLMGTGTGCDTNTLFSAFTSCRDTPGATTCGDSGECN